MKSVRGVLTTAIWLLPAGALKNRILRALGNRIGSHVHIAPVLVIGDTTFTLGDSSFIGLGNVFRNVREVILGQQAFIGQWNQMTAVPEYRAIDASAGLLALGDGAGIVNRHYLDCSGHIRIGAMAMVAGIKSVLQSHELDLENNRATFDDIDIGARSFTGTAVVILKGSRIPENSAVAAGTVWTRSTREGRPGLYGGTPARWLKDISHFAWFTRDEVHTPVDVDMLPFKIESDA